MVSAEARAGLDRALELGADDVLPKPFENEQLLARISELLGIEV